MSGPGSVIMRQTYREAFHRCIPRSYDAKRNASASGLRGPAGGVEIRPAAPERNDLQEPFVDPGVLRNRGMAGGWRLTQRAKVSIMITATSSPGFKLILNPNYDETMSKDRNSDATGKSDLFLNNTLPSSVRSGTRLTERQRRGEFIYTSWSDPVWETRHRPDNGRF
jgi:hypothetical protein